MARFIFTTSNYDKKAKVCITTDVTVYSKTLTNATKEAIKLANNPEDIYIKVIEQTEIDIKD